MSTVQSGAGPTPLTIDNNAMQVGLYTPGGDVANPALTGSYALEVFARVSSTPAAPAVMWAMWNPSPVRTAIIERIYLNARWVANAGAATEQQWEVVKGTGITATDTANNTQVFPVNKRGSQPAATTQVWFRTAAAAGFTGATWGQPIGNLWSSRLTQAATNNEAYGYSYVLDWTLTQGHQVELGFQEGLALRIIQTGANGDWIGGTIDFSERVT